MERKILTRQSTSGKRRVWGFNTRKRQHEDDEIIEIIDKTKKTFENKLKRDNDVEIKKINEAYVDISVEDTKVNNRKVVHIVKGENQQELTANQKSAQSYVQENVVESSVLEANSHKTDLDRRERSRCQEKTSPKITITKEKCKKSSACKTDSFGMIKEISSGTEDISLIIPEEYDLIPGLENFAFDSEQVDCLYSVQANHVELLKADMIELEDGGQAVKLPKLKVRTSLILIAVPPHADIKKDDFNGNNAVTAADKTPKRTITIDKSVKKIERENIDTLETKIKVQNSDKTIPETPKTKRGKDISENTMLESAETIIIKNVNICHSEQANMDTPETIKKVKNSKKTNSESTCASFEPIVKNSKQIFLGKNGNPDKTILSTVDNVKPSDKTRLSTLETDLSVKKSEKLETDRNGESEIATDKSISNTYKTDHNVDKSNSLKASGNDQSVLVTTCEKGSLEKYQEIDSPVVQVRPDPKDTSAVKENHIKGTKTLNTHVDALALKSNIGKNIGLTLAGRQMTSSQSEIKYMCYPGGMKVQIKDNTGLKDSKNNPDKFDKVNQIDKNILKVSNKADENKASSFQTNTPEVVCQSKLLEIASSIGTQIDFDEEIAKSYNSRIKKEAFKDEEYVKYKRKKRNTRERKHPCKFCGIRFSDITNLAKHKRIHTGERPYVCNICNKTFNQQSVLKKHRRIHTGEKPYKCDLCDKAFSDSSTLRTHVRFHTGERPFSCSHCDKRFVTQAQRRDHIARYTGETRFVCHLCGKGFTTSESFRSHVVLHSDEKPYPCNVCGKRFYSTRNRRRHMEIHSNNKKLFMCDICGKSISSSTNFTKHRNGHFVPKPHVCDICDKGFRDKNCYMKHIKAHKEKVPNTCQYCSKQFVKMSQLKRHILTHEEAQVKQQQQQQQLSKKPYECNICGKLYKDRTCFKKHHLSHPEAQNVIYKCEVCEKHFSTLSFLEEHLATHEQVNFDANTEYVFITADGQDSQFICSTCNLGFVTFEEFENHAQSHIDNTEVIYTTTKDGSLEKTIVEQVIQSGHATQTNEQVFQMAVGQANHSQQIKQINSTEQLEYDENIEHAKAIMQLSNLEILKPNSQNDNSKSIAQFREVENSYHENMEHSGVVNQAGTVNQADLVNNMVDHVEQVVIENGNIEKQTIVYVTVGSELTE